MILVAAVGATDAGPEPLLVGLVINGREVATFEVLRQEDGSFLLPLDELLSLLGATLRRADGVTILSTPLGSVVVDPSAVTTVAGVAYLTEAFVEERLAADVTFDREEFAVRLDLPWHPSAPPPAGPGPRAEWLPDAASMSTLRADLLYSHSSGDEAFTASATAAGRLLRGSWRLRYDDLTGERTLRDYAWYRTLGGVRLLAGHQHINLHPVLSSFELSGVQLAWTNQPAEIFPVFAEPREILPRRTQPVRTIRGPGPPGGFAELRIDGVVVAREQIGLDGMYEFLEVPLDARQLSRVEVRVFDRHTTAVPVAVHELTVNASEYLLAGGAVVAQGGLGGEGNIASEDGDGNVAGFSQLRWGATDGLTLEIAAQEADGRASQVQAGVVAQLVPGLVASVGAAGSRGRLATDLDVSGVWGDWRLLGRSQTRDAGFRGPDTAATHDHSVELGWRPRRGLDLSLLGRDRESDGSTSYLLPAVWWRAGTAVSARARPDIDGDYRLDLWLRPSRRTRLTATHQRFTALELAHQVRSGYELSAGSELGGDVVDRYSLRLTRQATSRRGLSWSAGLISSGGEVGGVAAVVWRVAGGVLARAEYQGVPLSRTIGEPSNRRIVLGLTANLGFAGGRVVPASSFATLSDRGAVAGSLRVVGGRAGHDLGGLDVLVDGSPRSVTTAAGSFFVANVTEGLHVVELDTERLPIELAVPAPRTIVEVADGGVTRVEIEARLELGFAGRVTVPSGEPAGGVSVEVRGPGGEVVARSLTDRFGLYRVDGLAPGEYLCVAVGAGGLEASRTVRLGDFLFGQDLRLGWGEDPGTGPED